MTTMTSLCASIDTLAMTYLDDELADEELRDFEMHLIDCAACRARVDAEREALADLRGKLAPPATPDVVRARLFDRLDAEDARAAREERKSRVAGWALPGAASFAAVAALALFAWSRMPEKAPDSVAADVVRTQMRTPQTVVPVQVDGAVEVELFESTSWSGRIDDGRLVANQSYRVRVGPGDERTLYRSIFEARQGEFEPGIVEVDGQIVIAHRTAEGEAYLFSSPDMHWRDVVWVVERFGLAPR